MGGRTFSRSSTHGDHALDDSRPRDSRSIDLPEGCCSAPDPRLFVAEVPSWARSRPMKAFWKKRLAWGPVVLLIGVLAAPADVAAAVDVGTRAPDFDLPGTTGANISLRDFRGKKWVFLECYGADFSEHPGLRSGSRDQASDSNDVPHRVFRGAGWAGWLRPQHARLGRPGGVPGGQDSQGSQPRDASRRAADEVRTAHQQRPPRPSA
jgi:hypothetical protein